MELSKPLDACTDVDVLTLDTDISVEGVPWPRRLRVLHFGPLINQPIDNVTWPPSLAQLEFGTLFDQPVELTVWLASLREVKFGHNFDQSISRVSWASLQRLELGGGFDPPIHDVDLPETLRHLAFGSRLKPARRRGWLVAVPEAARVRLRLQPAHRRGGVAAIVGGEFGERFNQPVADVAWPRPWKKLDSAATTNFETAFVPRSTRHAARRHGRRPCGEWS